MKLLVLCATLGVLSICLANTDRKEATLVDELRARLRALESRLWSDLDNEKNEVTVAQGEDVELMKVFRIFDLEVKAASPNRTVIFLEKSWMWSKTRNELELIDNLYKAFAEFASRQAQPGKVPAPVQEWLDLADIVLMDPQKSVLKPYNKIDEFLVHGDLFRKAMQDASAELCHLQQSPHQLLFNMYNAISLTEIKAYAMMQFSWMLLRIYGKGNFTEESNLMRARYGERTSRISASIRNAMNEAKREMYRCDPPQHQEGETYLQITRLLQGYIENEVDMNAEGTCSENCAFYALAENHGCFKDQYCARQAPCTGRIINCNYIDSDMWICPATSKSNRRYEWIEYENGRTLGRPGSCMRATSKVDSWWRWNLLHCSYCFCLCEESVDNKFLVSDRFFSLREAAADIAKNKIVTGLRFVKKNRVIHLQISEGTLSPRATVDHDSVRWQPVQNIDVNEDENKVDYHTLTYEERAIDLDELEAPQGHLLTGVSFRMIGAHLHFEIRATPFNYTTGKLDVEKSQWISNDNTEAAERPRTKLVLDHPDIPTRTSAPSRIDSNHDQYLEFTHTDLDADAAQTTVPFIDAQPVQPITIVPLSGAGIAHKGLKGSGGFITPKIFTYDYAPHMYVRSPNDIEYKYDKSVDFVPGVF